MTEIKLKKGEPIERAIRRLKKKLDREQTLQQFRLRRRFEKPSAKKRRKELRKAAVDAREAVASAEAELTKLQAQAQAQEKRLAGE